LSSSATDKPFQGSLEAALAMIAREQPELYGMLCRKLGRSSIDARVQAERVRIEGTGADIVVAPISPATAALAPDVISVSSDLGTIDALLDGQTNLLEVVWTDRVVLRGSVDQLLGAHDALMVFLRAAVRCPSAPEVLRGFREQVRGAARQKPLDGTPDRKFSAA
jgi:hypothetical protein